MQDYDGDYRCPLGCEPIMTTRQEYREHLGDHIEEIDYRNRFEVNYPKAHPDRPQVPDRRWLHHLPKLAKRLRAKGKIVA